MIASRSKSLFSKSRGSASENWISIADLMAGLMMVFLLLAIWRSQIPCPECPECEICIPILPCPSCDNPLGEVEAKIRIALDGEFGGDFETLGAKRLNETMTIRFFDDDILFDPGESKLKPEFKEKLDNFFPRYIEVLYKEFKDEIREVRIEGHTSSVWEAIPANVENKKQYAFIKNMELSQARTRETMQYVLALPAVAEYENWIREKVTANGLSSARLLNSEGRELQEGDEEDRDRSRRVEFSVRLDILEVIRKQQEQEAGSNRQEESRE